MCCPVLPRGFSFADEVFNAREDNMNTVKRSATIAWLTSVSLVLSLCAGTMLSGKADARSDPRSTQVERTKYQGDDATDSSFDFSIHSEKVSPDLREQLDHQSLGGDFSIMGVTGGAT